MEEILVETKFGRFGGFSLNCQPPSPQIKLNEKMSSSKLYSLAYQNIFP